MTDAGLERLKGLTNLQSLFLLGTNVHDAGLVHLKGLTRLETLNVIQTYVTDEGMEKLQQALPNLKRLLPKPSSRLSGWEPSAEQATAIAEIRKLGGKVSLYAPILGKPVPGKPVLRRPVIDVDFGHAQVPDAGLVHLKGLTNLQSLSVASTNVTDAGLANLKGLTNLQMLHLECPMITEAGLEHLKELNKLRGLLLSRTRVSDEGIKKLQQALPACKISSVSNAPSRSSTSGTKSAMMTSFPMTIGLHTDWASKLPNGCQ